MKHRNDSYPYYILFRKIFYIKFCDLCRLDWLGDITFTMTCLLPFFDFTVVNDGLASVEIMLNDCIDAFAFGSVFDRSIAFQRKVKSPTDADCRRSPGFVRRQLVILTNESAIGRIADCSRFSIWSATVVAL
uniref:Uncharacterized protein n=1 Tax=Romanomermis culicivorax TaxID=13658 RepID=A0A915JKK9_ROMCU